MKMKNTGWIILLILLIQSASGQSPAPKAMLSCEADFYMVLDSNSALPNTYHFIDNSSGDISSWKWDFGDGTLAEGPEVTHTYIESGSFQICLLVSNDQNPEGCYDEVCKGLNTPDYLYFGGQAFANGYPLNNPEYTGDVGIAYLYRVTDENLMPFDTIIFENDLGLYAFNFLMVSNYLIKVGLTPGSERFNEFFPTYFGNVLEWHNSTPIQLDQTIYNANVDLIPVQGIPVGPGRIHGSVNLSENPYPVYKNLNQNIQINLFRSDNTPLTFTFSDENGNFSFDNLPLGSYRVVAEYAGWYANASTVVIDNTQPVSDPQNMIMTQSGPNFIGEKNNSDISSFILYPNPAINELFLEIDFRKSTDANIIITNMIGQTVYNEEMVFKPGLQAVSIPVQQLSKGMYMIAVVTDKGNKPIVGKFMK